MNCFPSFTQVLILAALVRLLLVIYSEIHDGSNMIKYTDVDYRVFTDAARFLLNKDATKGLDDSPRILDAYLGLGNPYLRDTYRYTPLLAILMTPNITIHPCFGKIIFSICDLLIAAIQYNLFVSFPPFPSSGTMGHAELRRQAVLWVSGLWLLNPMVFAISTRGSSESILGLLVMGTLFLLMKGRFSLAAVLMGLAVHWKIYPVIYGASILSYLSSHSKGTMPLSHQLSTFVNKRTILFGVLSATTFVGLTITLYLIWGYPLLWNSYLYHLGRLDHRHNFSPYFYPTYLFYPNTLGEHRPTFLLSSPFLSFMPQMGLSLVSGILLVKSSSDLPLVWFVQTMIFVTFNKVCTSQYFIWYMWFLPLILPRLRVSMSTALVMVSAWVCTQAVWLSIAYRLEFGGIHVYLQLWGASILFFITNCWILVKIITVM